MTLLPLGWRSLLNRRFSVVLTVITIALSIALLVLVDRTRNEVRESFYRTVSGTDLIVGARTSPVQLMLYSVFNIGQPANNISWESYREIADSPEVGWAVPVSLGDAHRGYRVVGTSVDFFGHYRYAGGRPLEFAVGEAFDELHDAVIGYRVARELGYELGDEIIVAHGSGNVSFRHHDDHPFTVTGVLAPTGTPVDRSLYISLQAHRAIHEGWESGVRRPGDSPDPVQAGAETMQPDSVTAVFLGLKTRVAALQLQRRINEYRDEALSAVLPGMALQQLWRVSGVAEQALLAVSGFVVVAGLLGMLTVLLTTMNERRREMAILRALGARPWQISALLVIEAGLIVAAGIVVGVLLALALQVAVAPWLLARFGLAIGFAPPEAYQLMVLGAIFVAGLLVALVPAWMAYRRTVADGMQVKT